MDGIPAVWQFSLLLFRIYMRFALRSLFHDDVMFSEASDTVPLSRPCLPFCCTLCMHACGSDAAPSPRILPSLANSSPLVQLRDLSRTYPSSPRQGCCWLTPGTDRYGRTCVTGDSPPPHLHAPPVKLSGRNWRPWSALSLAERPGLGP